MVRIFLIADLSEIWNFWFRSWSGLILHTFRWSWSAMNDHEHAWSEQLCSFVFERTWTNMNDHEHAFFSKWLNTNQHEFINYRTGTNTNTRVFSSLVLVRSSQFWFPRKFSSPNFHIENLRWLNSESGEVEIRRGLNKC